MIINKLKYLKKFFKGLKTLCTIIGVVVLSLLAINFSLSLAYYAKNILKNYFSEKKNNTAVPGEQIVQREQLKHFNIKNINFPPYRYWESCSYNTKHTHVDYNGTRRTVKSPVKGASKVFIFGGSTVWGAGVEDKSTIPSLLQLKLGDNYDVYNYGELGYVSTQELNYLLELLSRGNIPDIVIFYDGVNDGYAGVYSPAIPRDPFVVRGKIEELKKITTSKYYLALYCLQQSNFGRVANTIKNRLPGTNNIHQSWEISIKPKIKENAQNTIRFYEAHIMQVKALSEKYGFKVFFFWQPNLFSQTKNLGHFEKTTIENSSEILIQSQRQTFFLAKDKFSNREEENIFFFGNILDNIKKNLYFDWNHLCSAGNEIIANEIYEKIGASPESAVKTNILRSNVNLDGQ